MPDFIPFIEDVLDVTIRAEDANVEHERHQVPESRADDALLASAREALAEDQVSVEAEDRLVHSHGQLSVDEIYRLLYGRPLDRVVDLVLYPQSEDDVRAIVRLADAQGVVLIPYGGGTNVSGALECPADESRPIASVDMRRMDRILWVDEANMQACVEAGIIGKDLEKALDERGLTTGHDPDSVELATLGGWIATNASGMKKNRYGNIEDIVLEATLVTPAGDVETHQVTPRNSTGVQPRGLLFGSEGCLGIITKAVMKIHPLPEAREYGSLVFPSFSHGVSFLRELRSTGVLPASIRLLSNEETRFGAALKRVPGPVKHMVESLQKFYLFSIRGFEARGFSVCTVLMEGTRAEVRQQRKTVFGLAGRHRGISAGSSTGQRGYALTFGIAYIRDFLNKCHLLGETFETSVPWDKIHTVAQAAREELTRQAEKHGIPGKPYLSHRVTQTYHTGVCVYFTMGFYGKGLAEPDRVFHQVERALRQVVLDNGGSLSHHHGVGKIRQGFMPQVQTEASSRALRAARSALDPHDVFAARNGVFTSETESDPA